MLLQQITVGASIAASGISSWTLDIGGFAGLDIDTNEVSIFSELEILGSFPDTMFVGKGAIREMVWDGCFPSIRELVLTL